jgi:hypothetical protein
VHLPNPNADKANAQQGKSLEVLLATKNKRILEELTRFRVRLLFLLLVSTLHLINKIIAVVSQILRTSLEASLRSMQDELADTRAELVKQQALCEKLETDLMALNTNNGSGSREEGGESGESGIAGLGLELGLRSKVFLLLKKLFRVVDGNNMAGRSWPEHNALDANTFHVFCGYVHPSNCDQSTGSIPSKECRARGSE